MEDYRKKIKRRMVWYSILNFIFVGLLIYDQFGASSELKNNIVFHFQCGLAIGCIVLIAIRIMRYRAMLEDERKMKLNYNKENDERTKMIRAKVGLPITLYLSVLMIVSGMIAGYVNEIIFITLAVTALVQMVISGMVKMWYMKRL